MVVRQVACAGHTAVCQREESGADRVHALLVASKLLPSDVPVSVLCLGSQAFAVLGLALRRP